MIDLHCHLLPGIDDGPDTLEEALLQAICEVIERYCTATIELQRLATPTIETSTITSPIAQDLLERLRFDGKEILVKDFSLGLGLPVIGVVRTADVDPGVDAILALVQNELFHLGSDLCFPEEERGDVEIPRLEDRHVVALEKHIDRLLKELGPLENFILPGGTRAAAELHLALGRASVRTAPISGVELTADAHFEFTIGVTAYNITVAKADTEGNADVAALVSDIHDALTDESVPGITVSAAELFPGEPSAGTFLTFSSHTS